MFRPIYSLAPGLCICVLLASAAAATTYTCQMVSHSRLGGIAPELTLIVQDKPLSAVASDQFILDSFGQPIEVKARKRSAASLQFAWNIPDLRLGRGTSSVGGAYEARLNTRTKKITMLVYLNDEDVIPRGSGTCVASG